MSNWDDWFNRFWRRRRSFFFPDIERMIEEMEREMAEAFKEMEKGLKKQNKIKEAKVVDLVVKKALESSYNYYKIAPQKIGDRFGIVMFSLIFYVVYTIWYGFSIMFMFEGWGLRLEH